MEEQGSPDRKLEEFFRELLTHLYGENIYDQIKLDFAKCSGASEKVNFAITVLKQFDLYPPPSLFALKKNDAIAAAFKLKGNADYAAKEYNSALNNYNQSLCYSAEGSQNIAIVYSNRSAVYYQMGFYKTCMDNVQLALENNCPDTMKPKLVRRREECVRHINNGSFEHPEIFELDFDLSYKPNPNVPAIVNAIELTTSDTYGRGLFAKRDFKPGDVLMIEEPFAIALSKDALHKYCFNCLKSNFMNLRYCTESTCAMFCSDECYNESVTRGFKTESKALDFIYNFFHQRDLLLCRTAFKLLTLFDDLDELKEILDSTSLEKTTAFDYNNRNASAKDLARAFFSLESVEHLRTADTMFHLSCTSAIVYYIITECSNLNDKFLTDYQKNIAIEVINRASQILAINYKKKNFLVITHQLFNDTEDKVIRFGLKASCIGLLTSSLNHSCAPNVEITGENVNLLSVISPIKSGEQLFVSYGPLHMYKSIVERKKHLKNIYFFNCNCVACSENYQMHSELPIAGISTTDLVEKVGELTMSLQPHSPLYTIKLKKSFKIVNKFIMRYFSLYPCEELYLVIGFQTTLRNLLYHYRILQERVFGDDDD